jgi:hypothetical protein
MYRRLPFGWRTTPAGVWTDLYMWQQFLAQPGCRSVSAARPTALTFPSPPRRGWTVEWRLAELEHWSGRIGDEAARAEVLIEMLEAGYQTCLADVGRLHDIYASRFWRLRAMAVALPGAALLRRLVDKRPLTFAHKGV